MEGSVDCIGVALYFEGFFVDLICTRSFPQFSHCFSVLHPGDYKDREQGNGDKEGEEKDEDKSVHITACGSFDREVLSLNLRRKAFVSGEKV